MPASIYHGTVFAESRFIMSEKKSMKQKRFSLFDMTLCALFAAVICVLSPISIQIGPIPVSLGLLGVLLAASVLGPVRGMTSVLVFVLAGACGLPVFSGGRGGFSVLIGPTGGYIWGYLSAAVIAGIRSDRIKTDSRNGKIIASLLSVVTCITGTVICYFCGTVQYCFVADIGFIAALAACVIPFIPLDILKCIFAGIFGTELRRILHRAGFNPGKRYKDSSVRDEHAEAKVFRK